MADIGIGSIVGAVGGPLIQIALSLAGEAMAQGDKDKAMALLQGGLDEYGKVDLPKLEKLLAEQLGPSKLAQLKADPSLRQAQNEALGSYDDLISGNGLAAADKADINNIGNEVSRQSRGSRDALEANMAARGALGSGAEYAAEASIASNAANTMANAGQNTQAQALRRRFDAILGKGQLATTINSQDFGQRAQSASAADEINRYNANARGAAAAGNNALAQQQYANQMGKLGAQNALRSQIAGQYGQHAQDTSSLWSGLGGAGSAAARGAGQIYDAYGNPSGSSDDPNSWEARKARGLP